jgi:hypothetical protein
VKEAGSMVPLYKIKRHDFILSSYERLCRMIQGETMLTLEACFKEHGHPIACNACYFGEAV